MYLREFLQFGLGWVCPGLFNAIKYDSSCWETAAEMIPAWRQTLSQQSWLKRCKHSTPFGGRLRVTKNVCVNTDLPACLTNSSCSLSNRHLKNVPQICRKAYTIVLFPLSHPGNVMKAQHSWDSRPRNPCGKIK